MESIKYILYLDNLQRLIMGEEVNEEGKLFVKNPVILHVQTTGTNINIQFFPIMFKEFLADKDQPTIWELNPANITRCKDLPLDARLVSQYKHIFNPVKNAINLGGMPTGQPPMPQNNSNVIKLFDE